MSKFEQLLQQAARAERLSKAILDTLTVDRLQAFAAALAFSIGIAAAVLMTTGVSAVLPAALRASRTDPRMALQGE